MNTESISNTQEIIDSRDIIERIKDLENQGIIPIDDVPEDKKPENFDEELSEELQALKDLENEANSSPDWQYGETLIHEDYFEEFARQEAEDLGLISDNAKWPCNHIDWEAAADELKQDYTEVNFDGETYYIRA